MHCNGKCYLYKQLQKAEEKAKEKSSLPNSIPKFKLVSSFVVENNNWSIGTRIVNLQIPLYSSTSSSLLTGFTKTLFKPPPFI